VRYRKWNWREKRVHNRMEVENRLDSKILKRTLKYSSVSRVRTALRMPIDTSGYNQIFCAYCMRVSEINTTEY